ncbi:MAG: HEPN domain-containing protein [Candidatus Cloacimonetes bacterium]|nr:HEPN domain-containing protein [Candidatus Cloacimonadota bacterium]MBL7086727.1 HEPN domain-containing protein [Candidatus Cloacimonadota bacterium]
MAFSLIIVKQAFTNLEGKICFIPPPEYWLKLAKYDLSVMDDLFTSKRYDYALFIGHLVLEKLLKAFWVRDNELNFPPKIHNLKRIADDTKLSLTDVQKKFLVKVNEFNIETRYPDYRMKFHKICDKSFTSKYLEKIKEFYKWLQKEI